ncbi:transposase [Massilia sp. CCM 8692]|uniref:Transposase n=1 Tax=Massilia rubra TaxID=2607910 RepID=A0ABX0LJL9_9BURK|nr:transposase [Massilia rubra]
MKLTTYAPQFRAEAVKLVLAQSLTLDEAAKRIAISKGTLANWVSTAKRGSDTTAPPGSCGNLQARRSPGRACRVPAHSGGTWSSRIRAMYHYYRSARLHETSLDSDHNAPHSLPHRPRLLPLADGLFQLILMADLTRETGPLFSLLRLRRLIGIDATA